MERRIVKTPIISQSAKMKRIALACLIISFALCNIRTAATSVQNKFDEAKPKILLNASITLKANIYFGDEDEESEAVSDTKFYLLSKSAAEILRNAKFEFEANEQPTDEEKYLEAAANAFLPNNREDAEFVAALLSAELTNHQRAELKTNKTGRGQIGQIKPGFYYLFGMTRNGESVLVWNLPITIKPGANKIELDQHNAGSVFTIED